MIRPLIVLLLALAACAPLPPQAPPRAPVERSEPAAPAPVSARARAEQAARNFVQVVETVEPVAERECRRIAPQLNCDFQIVVDDRPGQPPNAFQTVDRRGRPIIAFNLALIASARNIDELAFVMGHEAAHHVLDHIALTQVNANVGRVIFSGLAALTGAGPDAIRTAEELGAAVGARSYSKEFELEADRLGTVITLRSGYDPVRGAEFFTRIPDPGNRFLGTHPPNAERIAIVRSTVARLSQPGS